MGASESKLATPKGSPENAVEWQDCKNVKFCFICLKQFSEGRKRIYCMKCGHIACTNCCNNALKKEAYQVCSECFGKQDQQSNAKPEKVDEKEKEKKNKNKKPTTKEDERNINKEGSYNDRNIKLSSGDDSNARNIGGKDDERNFKSSGGGIADERNVKVSGGDDRNFKSSAGIVSDRNVKVSVGDDRNIKSSGGIASDRNVNVSGGNDRNYKSSGGGDDRNIKSSERNVKVSGAGDERNIQGSGGMDRNINTSSPGTRIVNRDDRGDKGDRADRGDEDRNMKSNIDRNGGNDRNGGKDNRRIEDNGRANAVNIQDKIIELQQESASLVDSIKRFKEISNIISDCKLKYQHIKKRDDRITEAAREDGGEDTISSLQSDKSKFLEAIAQNKKRIAEIDKVGVVQRRLLASLNDCEEGLTLISKDINNATAKKDTIDKEITQLQSDLSRELVSHTVSSNRGGRDGFNAQFSGEWIHVIPTSRFTSYDTHMKMQLKVDEAKSFPFFRYLNSLEAAGSSISISHFELIHNPGQLRLFHGAIDTLEKRQESGLFTSDLIHKETSSSQRKEVLENLSKSQIQADHNRKDGLMIVGGFHGTTAEKADSIIRIGFANLATLDDGWFGKGIYFTSHPEYASTYCKNKKRSLPDLLLYHFSKSIPCCLGRCQIKYAIEI